MYLWKYWRESRVLFIICIAGIALMFLVLLKAQPGVGQVSVDPRSGDPFSVALVFSALLQMFPLCFVAWLLGSFGVGRDLGEGSGSYIFSRPRSRAYFVWHDWSYGMAELLAIIVLLNLTIGYHIHRFMVAAGDPNGGRILLSGQLVPFAFAVFLNCVTALLFAALIFSLTYFSTVLLKHSRGLIVAVGALLGYMILKQVAEHYWPGLPLPSLIAMPTEIHVSGQIVPGLVGSIGLTVALRSAVIL